MLALLYMSVKLATLFLDPLQHVRFITPFLLLDDILNLVCLPFHVLMVVDSFHVTRPEYRNIPKSTLTRNWSGFEKTSLTIQKHLVLSLLEVHSKLVLLCIDIEVARAFDELMGNLDKIFFRTLSSPSTGLLTLMILESVGGDDDHADGASGLIFSY